MEGLTCGKCGAENEMDPVFLGTLKDKHYQCRYCKALIDAPDSYTVTRSRRDSRGVHEVSVTRTDGPAGSLPLRGAGHEIVGMKIEESQFSFAGNLPEGAVLTELPAGTRIELADGTVLDALPPGHRLHVAGAEQVERGDVSPVMRHGDLVAAMPDEIKALIERSGLSPDEVFRQLTSKNGGSLVLTEYREQSGAPSMPAPKAPRTQPVRGTSAASQTGRFLVTGVVLVLALLGLISLVR